MSKLAIAGGKPVRSKPFPAYTTIGGEERAAADRVLRSGILSGYIGAHHPNFYGGPEVRAFEEEWASFFGVKHAAAVNSCTSGLMAAVGAVGIGPGDEVIVTPYTMSATATSIMVFGGTPVFSDIEDKTFCLDPRRIAEKITPATRAIMVVDLFGHPFMADEIKAIARKHRLKIIEDCAQAPGALYKRLRAGTLGDIGVFSLNYHKHIHTGEGGVVVTNDDALAEKVRLIRNHAEAVVPGRRSADLAGLIGFNFRMTEIDAAIGRCQLGKLKALVERRIENCRYLSKKLSAIPGITVPAVRDGCSHVFYVFACKFDAGIVGVPRERFLSAVKAELPVTRMREKEGVLLNGGYVKPLYHLPLYQSGGVRGGRRQPCVGRNAGKAMRYGKNLCPTAERMHAEELFITEMMRPPMEKRDLDDVAHAFSKVFENRKDLL